MIATLLPRPIALLLCVGAALTAASGAEGAQGAQGAQEVRTPESFQAWRAGYEGAVAAFEAVLAAQGLGEVAPLHQLLRTASDWQRCESAPYALPPEPQWPAVLSTLRLLRTLRAEGVLGPFEIHSTHRDAALNACAGGAARSTHLVWFAVDLSPLEDTPRIARRLCDFWAQHGAAWQMGLSRYPSGRIHIDTWRHRTWGADHTSRSAFCAVPPDR